VGSGQQAVSSEEVEEEFKSVHGFQIKILSNLYLTNSIAIQSFCVR
jgi:hypothetical protein